jgi:hypothetical protein
VADLLSFPSRAGDLLHPSSWAGELGQLSR